MVVSAEHLILRELKKWRSYEWISYGIDGRGPIEDTLIKDIEDEHLLNIIRHLEKNFYLDDILSPSMQMNNMMYDELVWRMQGCWVKIL